MGQALLRQWNPGEIGMRQTYWRRHRMLKWSLIGLLCLLLVVGIATVAAARHAEQFLRAMIVARLSQRFHARVELDSFHISVAHGLLARGMGLRIWPPANVEGLELGRNRVPLVRLNEFHFRAPLHFPDGKPIRIWTVVLDGLTVDVPPRPHIAPAQAPGGTGAASPGPPGMSLLRFEVDRLVCNGARVILETGRPGKQPLEFDIRTMRVEHVKPSGAMAFDAVLTNPRPRGLIDTRGTFGPWVVEDPGETTLAGAYRFANADLSAFKGIAGSLSSTGRYRGSLREMIVDGSAETPNFSLRRFGTAMPLKTTFHARVDGTNGDTWLEPVNAVLGQTQFTARGEVVQVAKRSAPGAAPAPIGHEIRLKVDVEHGEIGDFLRLTSSSGQAMLTGMLQMKTGFYLPPGSNPVHERMQLRGSFRLQNALFTDQKLQRRIGELSLRGQGNAGAITPAEADSVRSTMEGEFSIDNAAVNLPHLVFIVPGAEIDLHGVYGIDGGSLAFRGRARLKAGLSRVVGGWKGWLLKPIEPLFRKDGAGTKVNVHVYGTRKDPQFGVDF